MKSDDAWKALGQVNEWIRFADAKATAVLIASGVLGGLLVRSIPTVRHFQEKTVSAVLLSVAIICVGCSALITLRTLAPRLRTGEARSLIYFNHIAKRYKESRSAFVENLLKAGSDEDRLVCQLAEQIWATSVVARRKFRRVSVAILFLGTAMVMSGFAVVVQRILNW